VNLVSPWVALAAAAVTVPLLLLLYFLKLRRRMLRIPSTLLWRGSVEDLQVNTPFQRLRYSVLLVLQLLVLAALLLALAQPRSQGDVDAAPRIVLVIDRSASMSATDVEVEEVPDATRLDAARVAAKKIIERLRRGSTTSDVLLLTFAESGQVVSGFESDAETLIAHIDAIEPGHGGSNLAEALRLADAFSRQTDEQATDAVDVILLSDGVVAPPGDGRGFSLQARELEFVRIGPDPEGDRTTQNVGIVSFSARRDYDDPARVIVFARLINVGPEDVSTVLTLRRDDEIEKIRRLEVPAADDRASGEASVTFELEMSGGAVLSLHHGAGDDLRLDDTAWLVLPPPRQPRVALVHAGDTPDPFLGGLLELLDCREVRPLTETQFADLDQIALDGGALFDLIVFDGVPPARLPGVPSLIFGGAPAGIETRPAPERGSRLLTWQRQHPLLRHVALDDVVFAGFGGFRLPAAATPLAMGPEGPVIAEVPVRGARHVLVGFEPSRSNWPVQVSFTVFMQNVLDYLTLAGSGQTGMVFAPGEPVTVRTRPDARELRITGPAGMDVVVPAVGGELKTLPRLEEAGIYTVAGANPPLDRVAVGLRSDLESDIRPRDDIVVNARSIAASGAADATPRELWPWLVAAAGLILLLEWLTYCRRMSR
jgi:hypothetical protein